MKTTAGFTPFPIGQVHSILIGIFLLHPGKDFLVLYKDIAQKIVNIESRGRNDD